MKLLFVEMAVATTNMDKILRRLLCGSAETPSLQTQSLRFEEMKLQIKLGVPHYLQHSLDVERVKSVFPCGKIFEVEVVDGGLICSSGVHVEEMGDKNDDCYIVNAAVYVGY